MALLLVLVQHVMETVADPAATSASPMQLRDLG